MLASYAALLTALVTTRTAHVREARTSDRGSVTLEQIAMTAGLVALALGVLAAIGVAVAKYVAKI